MRLARKRAIISVNKQKALFISQSLTKAWSMFSVKRLYGFFGTHYSLDINSLLAGVPCRGKQCLGGQVVNWQMTSPWAIRLAVQLCWCHAADCFKVYVCDITVSVTITKEMVGDGYRIFRWKWERRQWSTHAYQSSSGLCFLRNSAVISLSSMWCCLLWNLSLFW